MGTQLSQGITDLKGSASTPCKRSVCTLVGTDRLWQPRPRKSMSIRVLVVDDHEAFRHAARTVVSRSPCFELVGEAASGEESVDEARRLQPDLVLMDVRLPGMDGVEASRLITIENRQTLVVLISTVPADELGLRLASCGAAGFIPKEQFGPRSLAAAWAAAARD